MTSCVVRRPRHAEALEALAQSIRDAGGEAVALPADARDEDAMVALIEKIETEIAPIEVAVFNIGANVRFFNHGNDGPRLSESLGDGLFRRVPDGTGSGEENARTRARVRSSSPAATASVRGSAQFAAFAGAKHGLRALAQSMARELGPKNIHVAHTIIDGAIDSTFIREVFPNAG